MSKKPKPSGLIGVDGKPLVRAPKPVVGVDAPAATVREVKVALGDVDVSRYITWNLVFGDGFPFMGGAPKQRTLAEAVTDDLRSIHEALPSEWAAKPELPPPPASEMDTYDNAREWALRQCPHQNVSSTLYAADEFQCRDCGRYLRLVVLVTLTTGDCGTGPGWLDWRAG